MTVSREQIGFFQKSCLWLFLDYDGTLADFAPTPEKATPDKDVIKLIDRLSQNPKIRVTLISGRALGQLEKLVPLDGIMLAGVYGIAIRTAGGEYIYRVQRQEIRPVLDAIKPVWEKLLRDRPGFFLEDKDWALALHARLADQQDAKNVLDRAQRMAEKTIDDRFRLLGGYRFLEIGPRLAHKGKTVQYLIENDPLPGALLLYLGDDDKDEEAFETIHRYQGKAIRVASDHQKTSADFKLESPASAREFLNTLVKNSR
ncbi:MAG: trehalose-phosphatase [Anaerolineales bacterium]|nr:trehalose-phosphatase [Anaerolineales bacterium]